MHVQVVGYSPLGVIMLFRHEKLRLGLDLTRFNKIAIQGTTQ